MAGRMKGRRPSRIARVSRNAGALEALCYVHTAFERSSRSSRVSRELFQWVLQNASELGLDLPLELDVLDSDLRRPPAPSSAAWKEMRALLAAQVARTAKIQEGAQMDIVVRTAAEVGVSGLSLELLRLCLAYGNFSLVEDLWDRAVTSRGLRGILMAEPSILALFLGCEPAEISACLAADAPLRQSGLVSIDDTGSLNALQRLRRLIIEPAPLLDKAPRDLLLGPALTPSLGWDDFAHLGPDAANLRDVLRGAVSERAVGAHVLLYGAPGTGKTELAKTLADEIGASIHAVGEADADGDEPSRSERLSELRLAMRLLGGSAADALLLFDEAEDLFAQNLGTLFGHRSLGSGSKAFLHRLLERNAVPVIWTANRIDGIDPAILRRMACCIEVRIPPVTARAALWARTAAAEGVEISATTAADLASSLPVAPAIARSALRAGRLAGGSQERMALTARWAVRGVARAVNGGRLPVPEAKAATFDPTLICADRDLGSMTERLAAPGAPRAVSLLLSGPPGSGKSAYARYLAARMGLEVVQKRGSDLFGSYVGETEQRIAAAFAEARERDAFLIFDEADSFLADRAGAQRSWEVSQVNEMLTWMESHPLPFCCTTNLAERLDPASMRRFLVKARFGFLGPVQTAHAWRRAFGGEPPAALVGLDRLTPADFDLVRRQAAIDGNDSDPSALLESLGREQRSKPGTAGPIGFRAV